MSLMVEYRWWGEQIQITDVAATVPKMELIVKRFRDDTENELRLLVAARGEQFETLEVEFEQIDNLVSVDCIIDHGNNRLYWIEFSSAMFDPQALLGIDGAFTHIRIEPDGFYVTGYLSDREELFETREIITDLGLNLEVVRLEEVSDDTMETGSFLTDQQLEALVTAYKMGYYDVPKEATQAEVADKLGIAPPSVSERLTRGQQRLVEHYLVESRKLDDMTV